MFGKVKKWLGIEGVKLELDLPEMAFEEVGAVSGAIRLHSKHTQTVTQIRVMMIERYSRGRGKDKLVDEYLLGEITLDERIEVPAEQPLTVEFTLPFELIKAPIDEFASRNFINKGLAKLARTLQNARSEYRIEAEAIVEGTALNPFDRKTIQVIPIGEV
ncbi:MAG: hypothetical protein KatS3mg029_0589 [Saprospiraceae bacterium]|nr:MAG: hypothetical protein KatS3mg029_0589 [Saprospiraceae bacterium]